MSAWPALSFALGDSLQKAIFKHALESAYDPGGNSVILYCGRLRKRRWKRSM